jgi:hypothetical protein
MKAGQEGVPAMTKKQESNEERDEAELIAALTEKVYNGSIINWRYWVYQMPRLSAAQAARLLCGLDPDTFDNLDSRPNKNDPSHLCDKARKLQRLPSLLWGWLAGEHHFYMNTTRTSPKG